MTVELEHDAKRILDIDHAIRLFARVIMANGHSWHCQSKILNTWSGHRTAQIDPENAGKSMAAEIFVENDVMQTDEKRCKLTKRYI